MKIAFPDFTGRRRRLFGLAALLLVACALAVVALSGPQGAEGPSPAAVPHDAKSLGLVGLVALFVVYVLSEERRLAAREMELQQLMVREVSLRARLNEVSEMLDATGELARTFDLPTVLTLAARRVLPGLEAHDAAILLLNNRSGRLECAAAAGEGAAHLRAARVEPGHGVAGAVFTEGEPLTVESPEQREQLRAELGCEVAPASALCVPVRFQGTTLGVFCVCRDSRREAFTTAHARILMPVAEQCGAAVVKSFRQRQNGAGDRAA